MLDARDNPRDSDEARDNDDPDERGVAMVGVHNDGDIVSPRGVAMVSVDNDGDIVAPRGVAMVGVDNDGDIVSPLFISCVDTRSAICCSVSALSIFTCLKLSAT